tara:strand:- start:955 stop:1239 length:285 start_codon:yes stop_codon:yes gene_type:complete
MMLFVLICEDHPDSFELRQQVRPEHLTFLADYDVRFAGPMLSDDEESMVGSVIVIEAENLPAAQNFAAQDPYNLAGLFANVTVKPFKQVIPNAQ